MIAILLVCVVLFLAVLWQVQSDGVLVQVDGIVNARLAVLRTRMLLSAGAWISQVGTGAAGAILCLVASGLLWSDARPQLAWVSWLAFLGAQCTTWPLKFVTARVRPHFIEGITAGSPSFPSAHATVSMAVYLTLALVIADGVAQPQRWPVYLVAGLLIASISFSRLLLSLHYMSDVLAGALVGLFWAVLAWRLAV